MKTTFLLFDGFAALDVIGGYEVLANVPNLEIEFVAAAPGLVATDTRLRDRAVPDWGRAGAAG